MNEQLRLPVGIDDFEKIRKSDFYYGLFNGLYITRNQKLCEEYIGKYPVIFISLKSVEGLTYDMAMNYEIKIIGLVDTLESKLDSKQIQEIPGIVQDILNNVNKRNAVL